MIVTVPFTVLLRIPGDVEPMNKICPVILSAFGPPALACLRSWGRAGMTPGMICIQGPDEPRPASKYLADSICLSREDLYNSRGLSFITQFLEEFGASGLTCIDENIAQWLNREHLQLPDGVALWLPPNEMLQRVLDKVAQIEAARQVGLSVLPTYLFSGGNSIDKIPADHFPLCLRPSMPGSVKPSFKAFTVASLAELRSHLQTFEILAPIIGQPFVQLPNLIVHGARNCFGKIFVVKGFIADRKFEGLALTLRPVMLSEGFLDKCNAFIEKIALVGHYHFDFLVDDQSGEIYFLEINHRFGGTTAKALACGYQEPLYALQAQGIDVSVDASVNHVTVSNIKALCKSALYAMTGRLTSLDYPEESTMKRIWSTLQCLALCRDEVFAWDDLHGTAIFYFGNIYGHLSRTITACRRLLPPIKGDQL